MNDPAGPVRRGVLGTADIARTRFLPSAKDAVAARRFAFASLVRSASAGTWQVPGT